MSSQHELIERFLRAKRIALVGVSRNPADFSRTLWKELRSRSYDMVPVNTHQQDIDGIRCYRSLNAISPPVDAVLIMVGKTETANVITDCILAGVPLVWVYGVMGEKDIAPEVLSLANAAGLNLIAGQCPYMFLNNTAWFHGLHRFGWKLLGKFPR